MSLALIGGAIELFDEIPQTDLDACRDALDQGDYIEASFMCPAGTFLRELFTSQSGPDDDEDDEENEP
jgi:hypothetical protein